MELVTVASFDNQHQAHVAKLKLDIAEIESALIDLETVVMAWHLCIAIGYIKLQVKDSDYSVALEALGIEEGFSRPVKKWYKIVFSAPILRWLSLGPAMYLALGFAVGGSRLIAGLGGIWLDPLAGCLAAISVVLVAYIVPPRWKIPVATIVLFVGARLVWDWIPHPMILSPSPGEAEGAETYIPIVAAYVGGVLTYLGCAVFDTYYGEQSNQPLHQTGPDAPLGPAGERQTR